MGNTNLSKAKKAKNDEFYTQLSDIEKELKYYKHHFKGKHVFCNCDDPEWSNFWRYFALNFKSLGLKQLTSTHYEEGASTYRMDMFQEAPEEFANHQTFLTLEDAGVELPLGYITPLQGDGDFRSEESIDILKECDIVVTNPPFSIAREYYIPQLFEYNKDFLIIGDLNWTTYKTIFPLLKENKMWLGINNVKEFMTPSGEMKKFGNKLWFTNLDHDKRHEEFIAFRKYDSALHPTYDNYDAIEVSKATDMPVDYYGVMGVPISFLNKINPNQFAIVGMAAGNTRVNNFNFDVAHEKHPEDRGGCAVVDGKRKYARILIKRK